MFLKSAEVSREPRGLTCIYPNLLTFETYFLLNLVSFPFSYKDNYITSCFFFLFGDNFKFIGKLQK